MSIPPLLSTPSYLFLSGTSSGTIWSVSRSVRRITSSGAPCPTRSSVNSLCRSWRALDSGGSCGGTQHLLPHDPPESNALPLRGLRHFNRKARLRRVLAAPPARVALRQFPISTRAHSFTSPAPLSLRLFFAI